MEQFLSNLDLTTVLLLVHFLAIVITVLIRTPKNKNAWALIYKLIDLFAGNIGRAKDK